MIFDFLIDFVLGWTAFTFDVIYGSTWDPNANRVAPYTLSAEMITYINKSVNYTWWVWDERLVNDVEGNTEVFEDPNDRVVVRYDDGACYVAFKGNEFGDLDDTFQSWTSFPRRLCGEAGCCFVNHGVYDAYFSDYVEEFEAAVDRCRAKCVDTGDGGCPLIITGHSQGAAIAPVAAIALSKHNPILLTYGQHPAIWFRCGVLDDMETYLRFRSQCEQRGEPFYDAISYQGIPFLGRQTGTLILISPGGASTVAYNDEVTFFPIAEPCHQVHQWYIDPLAQLQPGPLDGFDDGSLCTRHIECRSRSCENERCVAA